MSDAPKSTRSLRERLLTVLQADSDRLNKDIADELGTDASRISRLRSELKSSGHIKQCKAILDPDLLGLHTCAFILLQVEVKTEFQGTIKFLLSKPEVQELHCIEGEYDFLLKIRTGTNRDLFSFVTDVLVKEHNVARTNTIIVMDTRKETLDLDLNLAMISKLPPG
jgi:Lrp/AsnC family transcriptional regulator, leucine-responsive regulatory protein